MKPNVGQLWISRKNDTIEIIHYAFGKTFPVIGKDSKGIIRKYSREGYIISIDFKHEDDLIRNISNES